MAWVRRNCRQLVSVCRDGAGGMRWRLQDPPDRRGADAVAELEQLALEPHVPPARVLPRHPHHQGGEDVVDRWPSGPVGVGPSSADEEAMPAQERWRNLVLPGIFPYLITGLVTASGGAWNASIVAEYFRFKGQIISTVGLGATISRATDTGNFNLLLAATCVMAAIVVVINRTVWRRLYVLAETRFKLES